MSTNYIEGETIVFKSRTSNPVITLKPEPGKTLNIQGYTAGVGTGLTTTVNQEINDISATSTQTLVSDEATIGQMGYDVAVAREANYLVGSGPDFDTLGGGGIVYTKVGSTWQKQQAIFGSLQTFENECGRFVRINEDGSQILMATYDVSTPWTWDTYSRSGTTWTRYATLLYPGSGDISGTRTIFGDRGGLVEVYNNGSLEQELQAYSLAATNGARVAISKFGATAGSICAFTYETGVKVFTRSGTTWTLTKILGCGTQETSEAVSLALNNTTLVASYPDRTYIYDYESSDWYLSTTIESLSITKAILPTPDLLYLYKTNEVSIYIRDTNNGSWYYSSTTTLTGDSNFAGSATEAFVGKKTVNSVVVYPLTTTTPSTEILSFDLTSDVLISSQFPVIMRSTELTPVDAPVLRVFGKMEVTDTIQGSMRSQYASLTLRNPNLSTVVLTTAVAKIIDNPYQDAVISNDIYADVDTAKLICVNPGYYLVHVNGIFGTNSTGMRELKVIKNVSTDVRLEAMAPGHSTKGTTVNASGIVYLVAGDYLRVQATQNSGGNLNLNDLYFEAIKLGVEV